MWWSIGLALLVIVISTAAFARMHVSRQSARRDGPAPLSSLSSEGLSQELKDLASSLLKEWYGLPLSAEIDDLNHLDHLHDSSFAELWERLWFAKGFKQTEIDIYLQKYRPLFDVDLSNNNLEITAPCSVSNSPHASLLFLWAWVVLYDQIARNIFRGTPRAYQEVKAKRLVLLVQPQWAKLPPPMLITLALVYIHSEDVSDIPTLDEIVTGAEPDMRRRYPAVWDRFYAIYQNQRGMVLSRSVFDFGEAIRSHPGAKQNLGPTLN